jgi:hypothetical protein
MKVDKEQIYMYVIFRLGFACGFFGLDVGLQHGHIGAVLMRFY